MFNLFKKQPIVPGDCWVRKGNEFLSTIIRVREVGKRKVLCEYVKIDGKIITSYVPLELSKYDLRSDYWCNIKRPKTKDCD